jgi:hypothetical protein
MLELKKILFRSLYTWIGVCNNLPISNFSSFLEFCSFPYIRDSLVCLLCTRALIYPFNEFELYIIKVYPFNEFELYIIKVFDVI